MATATLTADSSFDIAAWRPRHNPWLIALTVTLATFMEVLDTSIANVALPHIAGSLGASSDESTWVLTSYLVSNAIILPISAWLATRMGRKRFYMSCVALFAGEQFPLRPCAQSRHADFLPRPARCRRRRTATERTSHPRRHLLPLETRHGLRRVRNGGGRRARDRPHDRRMDHRQLQLALDFLHQRSDQPDLSLSHPSPGRRSAVPENRKRTPQRHSR